MSGVLDFRLLGPLDVLTEGRSVPVRGFRKRGVLAMLVLEHERVVSRDRLVQAIWGEQPPATARNQVHICVSELRSILAELSSPARIVSHRSGYLLTTADDSIDVERFRPHRRPTQ